jgi:Lon protease-like protein
MRNQLPARPNLDHLKSQAKDLLDAVKRNDPSARDRIRETLPSAATIASDAFALHDAQSVIAREYGFQSWADLRAEVEARSSTASPTAEAIRTLMAGHPSAPLPREIEEALLKAAASRPPPRTIETIATLPVLPLRNAMLAVGAVAPFDIGRPSTLEAIADARANHGGLMAAFSQRDASNEAPDMADIHPVGCLVEILSAIDVPGRLTKALVVRATQWIHLDALEHREPFLRARVSPFAVTDQDDARIAPLERELRERVNAITKSLPGGDRLVAMTSRMNARELADAVLANVPCSVDDKSRCASEPSLTKRIGLLLALLGAPPG